MNDVWKKYEQGCAYNRSLVPDLYSTVDTNIEFFAGDASSFMQKIPKEDSPSLVIVDPPRAGLSGKMREELIALSPEKVIYVSCNPQTMARDVKDLGGAGYALVAATPVNMFPMTKHVECVAVIRKNEK